MKLNQPVTSRIDKVKKIKFPSNLSNELSELIGIHIGDGHLAWHKSEYEYIFQLAGHPIKDKLYYDNFVTPLLNKLFNIKPKAIFMPCKVYGYQIYSKGIVTFLINNFNLPDGKKCHSVSIPNIFFDETKFLKYCLRGIIDTDFFLYLSEDRCTLAAWFASKNLTLDLKKAFEVLGIRSCVFMDDFYIDKRNGKKYIRHRIQVPKKDIRLWFEKIGTHHPVLKCKYINWTKGILLKDKDILNNPEMLDKFALVDSSNA